MLVRASIAIPLAAAQLLWSTSGLAQATAPTPEAPMQEVPASAEAAMDAAARSHFQLGRAFYDAGRFAEASAEFSEAYRLSKRPELLYNVYVASRDAGQLQAAVDALRGYLEQVKDAPDSINLEARLKVLEAQLAQREADARARDEKLAEANARADAPRVRKERVPSVVPWVLMGSGAALGVAAAVTGGLALGKRSHLDDSCVKSTCRSASADDISTLKTLSVTTDVLIGVGSAAAVTGLVLLLTHALDSEREVPYVSVFASPHQLGSTFTTRF